MLKNQAKRKVLIAQLNSKLSESNEKQLELAISKHFKDLQEEVLKNLEEYWNDAMLLQGHIDLILAPIEDSHEAYYKILEKHNKKEYRLGEKEAERIIDIQNKHAEKSIRRLKGFFNKKRTNPMFGTIDWSEEDLLQTGQRLVESLHVLALLPEYGDGDADSRGDEHDREDVPAEEWVDEVVRDRVEDVSVDRLRRAGYLRHRVRVVGNRLHDALVDRAGVYGNEESEPDERGPCGRRPLRPDRHDP